MQNISSTPQIRKEKNEENKNNSFLSHGKLAILKGHCHENFVKREKPKYIF